MCWTVVTHNPLQPGSWAVIAIFLNKLRRFLCPYQCASSRDVDILPDNTCTVTRKQASLKTTHTYTQLWIGTNRLHHFSALKVTHFKSHKHKILDMVRFKGNSTDNHSVQITIVLFCIFLSQLQQSLPTGSVFTFQCIQQCQQRGLFDLTLFCY